MRQKRIISILIIMVLIGGILGGCGIVQVNPEKDREQIIAKVNDEEILKGQLLDQLDREKSYYNLTEQSIEDPNNKEQVLEIKKLILDGIITETLLNQKAQEAGFVVTEELRDEAKQELDDMRDNIRDQLEEADKADEDEEDDEDSEDIEDKDYAQQAREYIENQLAAMGKTEEEYIEYLAEQKCVQKLYETIVEDVQVSEDEVAKYYEEQLAEQKDNPNSVDGSPVVLYEPSSIRIRHLSIDIPEDKINQYNQLLEEKKEDEAKELSDKELGAIKAKADAILTRAKSGEDFMKLVEEINPSNAEFMDEGMTIHKDSPYLPDEFKDAAFKLDQGEISGLVKTPYGYFIIELEEKIAEKIYSLDEKKDDIMDKLTDDKETEKWKTTIEEWKEVGITRFEKRL